MHISDVDIENKAFNPQKTPYPLRTIYFYLTNGCNLACRHCWVKPTYWKDGSILKFLPFDLFNSIIDQALPLGLGSIKLTGGEPLLHPDILNIIDAVRKRDLGLNVETNGLLCTPEIAQAIAGCKDNFISISLDGANAQTHEWVRGVPGCFESALKGLRLLTEAGLRPQVIMTLMKRNANQIEDLVDLAQKMGAGSIKLNLLQPTARGESLYEKGETLTVREILAIGSWIENELSRSTKIPIIFDHPPAFRPLGRMFAEKGNVCSICGIRNILGVLATGSYALCGIGETMPELTFGHAASNRLEDVWNGSTVLQEIRRGLPDKLKGICSDCAMKNLCLGSCIAQNYYSKKDLYAPFWYCEAAYKEGVFPESRLLRRNRNGFEGQCIIFTSPLSSTHPAAETALSDPLRQWTSGKPCPRSSRKTSCKSSWPGRRR